MANSNWDPKLTGVKALTEQLRALGRLEDGKAIRAAVRAGGKIVLNAAIERVPIGTRMHKTYKGRTVHPGFALASLRMITVLAKNKLQAKALIGVRKEAYYALKFVELGTSKMAAQPWLRPTFEAKLDSQKAEIKSNLQRTINTIVRKNAKAI